MCVCGVQECKQLFHCCWTPAASEAGDKLEQFIEHAWELDKEEMRKMRYSQRGAARRTSTFSALFFFFFFTGCPVNRLIPWQPYPPAASPFARFYLPEVCCKTHKACEPIMEIEVKEAGNSLGDDGSHFFCAPMKHSRLNSRIHLYVLAKLARGYGVMRRRCAGSAAFIIYLHECICSCFNKQRNE